MLVTGRSEVQSMYRLLSVIGMMGVVQIRLDERKRILSKDTGNASKAGASRQSDTMNELKSRRKLMVDQRTTAARILNECCGMCELILLNFKALVTPGHGIRCNAVKFPSGSLDTPGSTSSPGLCHVSSSVCSCSAPVLQPGGDAALDCVLVRAVHAWCCAAHAAKFTAFTSAYSH